MELEIYRRPVERPSEVVEDKDIRVYYAGKWVDFRNGKIRISTDDGGIDKMEFLENQNQDLARHCEKLQAEINSLKEKQFAHFANEECWIYQGDGTDHLESLVCPVVISPQKLIELGG